MNLKLLIALFLIIVCSSNLCSQAENEVDSLYYQGKYDKAIESYSKLILQYPENSELYRKIGVCYFLLGFEEQGNENIRKSLLLNDKCHKCHLSLCENFLKTGRFEEAYKQADSALKIEKTSTGYFYKGIIHQQANNFYDAISELSEALFLDSLNSGAYYYRAISYKEIKFKQKAEKDFLKAIVLDSTQSSFYYELALLYNLDEHFEKSIPILKKAIELDSLNGLFLVDLGSAYHSIQEYNLSNNYYFKAKKLDFHEKAKLNYFIADNYYKMENMDSSCYYLNIALNYNSDQKDFILDSYNDHCDTNLPNYYFQRGIALYNLNRYKESIEFHEKGIIKFPKNSWLWNFKGNSLIANYRYEEAILSYKKSIEFYSNQNYSKTGVEQSRIASKSFKFSALYSISECFLKLNQIDSAEKYLKLAENKALKLQNSEVSAFAYSQVSFLKGEIAFLNNNEDKAISFYSEAIRLWTGNNSARYKRAMLYFGRNCKNIKKYKTATLKYNPILFEEYEYKKSISPKSNELEMQLALDDCDKIIELYPKESKAFMLRAILKKELGKSNYCSDIEKAIELGIPKANHIANLNCKI